MSTLMKGVLIQAAGSAFKSLAEKSGRFPANPRLLCLPMSTEKKALVMVAVCLFVMGVGLYLMRGREAPAVVTRERLAGLQTAIEEWHRNKGSLPESLEELGLDDESIRDHSGTVFEYTPEDDGTVTLISYGVDGKPGGYMFRSDSKVTFKLTAPVE